MKKVLIVLTALTMATSVMAAGRTVVETRVGGSFAGAYKTQSINTPIRAINFWDKKTSGIGYEVAVEGSHEMMDNFFLGLGVAYQNHAKSKNVYTEETLNTKKAQIFKSVPVYLTAKYQFDLSSEVKPFVKANLGYSFNLKESKIMGERPKIENGLYYAVGAGVDYNNFVLDLSYQVNQGKVRSNDSRIGKLKADHSRVTLGLGYRFNL